MPYYHRRPQDTPSPSDVKNVTKGPDVKSFTADRQSRPPFGDARSTLLSDARASGMPASVPTGPTGHGAAVPELPPMGTVAEQAAALLPRATAILDDDMTHKPLGIAGSGPRRGAPVATLPTSFPPGEADFLGNLSSFAEKFAALLPRPATSHDSAGQENIPNLRARGAVRAGASVELNMHVHNDHESSVTLRPMATALLSDSGMQVPAHCVVFSQQELTLAPGARTGLGIHLNIPVGSAPGCYTGLIVMSGIEQSRALICVQVQ